MEHEKEQRVKRTQLDIFIVIAIGHCSLLHFSGLKTA